MKKKVIKNIAIFSLLVVLFEGCNKTTHENILLKEYTEYCLPAFNSLADDDLILKTIAYMDNIIAKEGNNNITTIYYNKAALLYKLKRYDEALDTIFQTNDKEYDVYKATLLIRLGRIDEAIPIFQSALDRYKEKINELVAIEGKANASDRTKNAIQGLMMYYILLDLPKESILSEFTSENILTQYEAEVFFQKLLLLGGDIQGIKEMTLKGLWPERYVPEFSDVTQRELDDPITY